MATDIGQAFVQIVPSARGIKGSIEGVLGGESESAGKKSGLAIAGGIKKIVAAAGIGAAIKKSLDYGGELQQNLGGTEAVFGKHAANLQKTAKDAYKNMGLSASDYMATANKMGSLFQGSGLEQTKSLQLTQDAMQRAADVASVMGIDTQWAMDSIAAAAKGQFNMMDNLGVKMSATAVEAYALEKGMNFKWNTATEAEKAEVAMQMFMDRTSQYQGNFARESEETLSGSIGMVKASWQDLLANLTLGTDVSSSMQNLVQSAITAAGNILPAIGNIFKSLPTALVTAIQTGLPLIAEQAGNLITGLTDGINTKIPELASKLPGMISTALDTISTLGPQVASKGMELLQNLGQAIINNAPKLASAAKNAIEQLVNFFSENFPQIAAKGGEIIGNLVKGIIKHLPQILVAVVKIGAFLIKSIGKISLTMIKAGLNIVKGLAKGLLSGIGSAIKGVMEKIKEAISKPIEDAKNKVKGILDKVRGFFPLSIGKIFSNLKVPHINVSGGTAPFGIGGAGTKPSISVSWYKKAMGNPYLFSNATLFGAGESGDEVLYGRDRLMKDIENATSKASGDTIINLNYDASDDAQDMLRDLVRGVRRYKMAGAI